jgi:probable phosphoglycerate mutase
VPDEPQEGGATPSYRQLRFVRPIGATEIVLVRHGETVAARPDEPFPLIDGQGDPGLSVLGHEQAERVAERLAGSEIAAIYVTTLRRTVETAAPLVERTGLAPMVEADLREVGLGEWEGGLFRQKVVADDPVALRMYDEERWDVIPGAESNEEFALRLERGIRRIAGAHVDQRVVVFSHGGAIGMTLAIATGSRPFSFVAVDNAALSALVVTPDRWVVRSFNETAHLV